jgi:T-complex protein 1 subunit gamma
VGTKFSKNWGNMIVDLAYNACQIVFKGTLNVNKLNAEIKRYAKIEKIPGGLMSESKVVNGVFVNKDLTHPAMRKKITNPRVILLDCPLEYKKGESQTNMEMSKETDIADALKQEMAEVAQMCTAILKYKPDVVITEKGVSDLA